MSVDFIIDGTVALYELVDEAFSKTLPDSLWVDGVGTLKLNAKRASWLARMSRKVLKKAS